MDSKYFGSYECQRCLKSQTSRRLDVSNSPKGTVKETVTRLLNIEEQLNQLRQEARGITTQCEPKRHQAAENRSRILLRRNIKELRADAEKRERYLQLLYNLNKRLQEVQEENKRMSHDALKRKVSRRSMRSGKSNSIGTERMRALRLECSSSGDLKVDALKKSEEYVAYSICTAKGKARKLNAYILKPIEVIDGTILNDESTCKVKQNHRKRIPPNYGRDRTVRPSGRRCEEEYQRERRPCEEINVTKSQRRWWP